MKAIEIYMNINGRGAEAITFYEEVFNTKANTSQLLHRAGQIVRQNLNI